MSILEELKQTWTRTQALVDLVPPDRVFIGPPNPGAALLCIGFTSERISHASRSSTTSYQQITVEALTQAPDPAQLEKLRDRIEEHLAHWQTERYQTIVLQECTIVINRDPQSPSKLWLGELSLTWQTMRIVE